MKAFFLPFLASFLSSFPARAAEEGASSIPNIVVIMANDLGYGDLSCYGAKRVQTPHIDRFAQEGLRFTNGYASASTSTPTRFSLLTGKYAFRQPGTNLLLSNGTAIIPPETPTLASVLKKAGYQTAIIGKWHLGLGQKPQPDWNQDLKPGPLEIGFDSCFLLPTTNDRAPNVYVENHRVKNLETNDPLTIHDSDTEHPGNSLAFTKRNELRMNWSHGHNDSVANGIGRIGTCTGGEKARWKDEDLSHEWVNRAQQWIATHKNQHFFLLLTPHNIHVPRLPSKEFQGKSTLGPRGDAILELDWIVGEIRKSLDTQGLTKNTLVIFCSDNGPILDDGYQDGAEELLGDHQPSGPFRGGKYTSYEGGTRVPLITWWPEKIFPGTSNEVVSTIDLAASLSALVKQPLQGNDFPDSFDLLPAFLGHAGAKGRISLIEQGSKELAIRQENWKFRDAKTPELFDLAQDPAEKINLIEKHPDIAKRLKLGLESVKMAGQSRPE